MATLQRLAILGKELLMNGRLGPASQQLSSLRSLESLGSSPALPSQWTWTDLPGWQRIVSLVPSLADVQLWAAPKQKVDNVFDALNSCAPDLP